jgi:hypothetical protein
MRVIWDRHIWSLERGDQWERLRASSQQHTDHIHVEQFWMGAGRPASVQSQYEAALAASRA